MDILKTLQKINSFHGPSGDEGQVADAIAEFARPYADEITRDVMGNLIVHKKGNGPRIMFAAHMDSIGFVITHIDDKGFLRVGRLGGLDVYSCLHIPVRFKNGVKGVVASCAEDDKKMTLDDLYIDIGATSREEAETRVQLGDTAVFDFPAFQMGERISSPYLDNRISCVVLLMALEQLKGSKNDLYFVFTTQEELGMRGARPAAFGIEPQYGIAVDVTGTDDELESEPEHGASSHLGHGAAIKIMDSSVICHPQVVQKLEELARESGIKAQRDILRYGGTDAGAIHISRSGVYTGGVSVPCRYVHSPVETADLRDVEACGNLIAAFAQAELG